MIFNENDPYAAQWLRNLYPDAVVDGRSIVDVEGFPVMRRMRVHLFAGIGGWEYALKLAGWPVDRPVWTGSCPCQPFSVAGKGLGEKDERHLWPEMFRLIRECRPGTVFGEQVANAGAWLDGVFADLEGEGYTCGAAVLGAHSVGAPHIRQRIYWVAHSERDERWRQPCGGTFGRVGWKFQPVPWNKSWECALSQFRALANGVPRSVGATDAARNAIVPQVAATFVRAFMEMER